jgi:hypothetical protein
MCICIKKKERALTHAASNHQAEAELWVMDQEVAQMVVLPVIAVQLPSQILSSS